MTLSTTTNTTLPAINLIQPGQRILLTGGTGFIGKRLTQMLFNAGHEITILTRSRHAAADFQGSVTLLQRLDEDYNQPSDIIINLAGEPIGNGRWTDKKKQEIVRSRIDTTQALVDYIARLDAKPKLLLSGSAIGYYGTDASATFTEQSLPERSDFSHELCQQWEQTALQAEQYGVRVALLRTGIVLGAGGGALAKMLLPFKCFLGGPMGSGQQWMSWIHIDDLIGIIETIINDETLAAAVNGTAPEPVTNQAFSKALGKALKRPAVMKVPAFNMRLMFGEMADALLLNGQKVVPEKALQHGYAFKYPTIDTALAHILG